jgi:hypothetical protein
MRIMSQLSFLYTCVKLKEKNAKALLYGFILTIQVDVITNVVWKHIKVEKDTIGKKKLVNEFVWISYILFFGMHLTKYQNLRIGFQAYF